MTKEQRLLNLAEDEARKADTWADLSNALFNPIDGHISKAFPSQGEREAFIKTYAYKQIRKLLSDAMDRTGLIAGATPKRKSGRFVVRLPQSLHAALEGEAKREGVSLNQLVVAKLAVQLNSLVNK